MGATAPSAPRDPIRLGDLAATVAVFVVGTVGLGALDFGALIVVALSGYCEDECTPASQQGNVDGALVSLLVGVVVQLLCLILGLVWSRRAARWGDPLRDGAVAGVLLAGVSMIVTFVVTAALAAG